MTFSNIRKTLAPAAAILALFLLDGAMTGAAAYSVDVTKISYSDPLNARSIEYDFSGGTQSGKTITIPDYYVLKATADAGLSYTFGPYTPYTTGETNDIAVALDTFGQRATLSGGAGGSILSTSPSLPAPSSAPNQWTFSVQLRNFVDISNPGKRYETKIGLRGAAPGPRHEFTASWVVGGDLMLKAGVIDDSKQTDPWLWTEDSTPPPFGFDPATAWIEMRIRQSTTDGIIYSMFFDYRIFSGSVWLEWVTFGSTDGLGPIGGFPANFPYVSLNEITVAEDTPPEPRVYTIRQQSDNNYYLGFVVQDPARMASAVTVTGSKYIPSGGVPLTYDAGGSWSAASYYLVGASQDTDLGSLAYTFNFTPQSGRQPIDPATQNVTGYLEQYASDLQPQGTVTGPVTFSWTGILAASNYSIELFDSNQILIWTRKNVPPAGGTISVPYTGSTPLTAESYSYNILSWDSNGNASLSAGSFTRAADAGSATVSFTNSVVAFANYPNTPIAAADVSLVSNDPLISAISTQTYNNGVYNLENIPAGPLFAIKIVKAGFLDVYSALIRSDQGYITGRRPYVMYTAAEADAAPLNAWTDKLNAGIILGKVLVKGSEAGVADAVITAVNKTSPSTSYPVAYTGGGAQTAADGLYYVFNVPDGVAVDLRITRSGYTWDFTQSTATAHKGAVTQESFFGTEAAACTYALSPQSASSVPSTGATATVRVTTGGWCSWTTGSNADWLTPGLPGGKGSGDVVVTIKANTDTTRTGTVAIAGQTFTVIQAGSAAAFNHPLQGRWGALTLSMQEGGTQRWQSETSQIDFKTDWTGSISGPRNDSGATPAISPVSDTFTYTIALNADGSYAVAMKMKSDGQIRNRRVVLSDNGNTAIMDGTSDVSWAKLMTLVKIDTSKIYSAADLNGDYYALGYERDPSTSRSVSSVQTFAAGAGTYGYVGRANSFTSGALIDLSETAQPYAVTSSGSVSMQGSAFSGFLTGNRNVGIGGGSFDTAAPNVWKGYHFLRKADKIYTTADLAGSWALASVGDGKVGSAQTFSADFGSMTCNAAGRCVRSSRSLSSGVVSYSVITMDIVVAADGSFGVSPGSTVPYGAIGNNGNTILFNPGITNLADLSQRRAAVAVKATGKTNLSGGRTFNIWTGSFLDSGKYYAFVNVADPDRTIGDLQVAFGDQTADAGFAAGYWTLGISSPVRIDLGAAPPVNAKITVSIRDGASGPWYRYEQTIGSALPVATNLAPSGTIAEGSFSFVFTGISGGETYYVQLLDPEDPAQVIWNSDRNANLTTIPYAGPDLMPGLAYPYEVIARIGSNQSVARGVFTYGPAGPSISFTGNVKDAAQTAVDGATIEQAGSPTNNTLSNAGGFTLAGLPGGLPFRLKISKGGYETAYSAYLMSANNMNADAADPFTLFPAGQLASWGVTGGKGVIRGRVVDASGVPIAGATVSGISRMGQYYPVCYDDACTAGLTTTDSAGLYVIKNVEPGDIVTVRSRKKGFDFRELVFKTYADGISQGRIEGMSAVVKGDINGDGSVDLADMVLALKVAARINPVAGIRADLATARVDVNGDGKIGIADAQFVLQKSAGLRPTVVTGTEITLVGNGHPPVGFDFTHGKLTGADGDFVITGGDTVRGGYGWLKNEAGLAGLGIVDGGIDAVGTAPEPTQYRAPQFFYLAPGRCYTFRLANGNYAVIEVKSVRATYGTAPGVRMVFDYKYQSDGSRNF